MLESINEAVKNFAIAAQEGGSGTSDIAVRNAETLQSVSSVMNMVEETNQLIGILEQDVSKFHVGE